MNKEQLYQDLLKQLTSLLEDEHNMIACMANISAVLYDTLPEINWAGFYLYENNELILGPFQGKVACMHIPYGRGVCGTCIKELKVQRIDDVHKFPGHIACDASSNSEIVLPIQKENTLIGVLDIDSYVFNRFDAIDEKYLSQVVLLLLSLL